MNKLEWFDRVAAYIGDNLEDFYGAFYEQQLKSIGSDYRLQPCPMCGHNDCCTITKNNSVHCFSCDWKGTHINAFIEYITTKKGGSKNEAIKELEKFTGLTYPRGKNKEEYEKAVKYERIQEIKLAAVSYYHEKLMSDITAYSYYDKANNRTIKLTPLEYQLSIRKHQIETLKAFRVGFAKEYIVLWNTLIESGYTEDEIKEAKIWFPDGVFVYTSFHPVTKDVLRMNIKNPFNITMKSKKDGSEEIVQGMSSGDKVLGFAPGFSFNKPVAIVEGENDAQTIYEEGFTNVCWTGGNLKVEQLDVLERLKAPLFVCTDNDKVGEKYVRIIDEALPHKDVRKVTFDENYNDIDDYYKKNANPKDITELFKEATMLETEAFKIFHKEDLWVIVNRHKKLKFAITGKDNMDRIIGKIDYYVGDVLKDREEDKPLGKCRANKRPFNFYLQDRMEMYFNTDLEERSFDELLSIYKYCSHKSQIIKLLAKHAYKLGDDYEDIISSIKIVLGGDVCDAVLKEVNDLQNIDALRNFSNIPKMKVSHYFNVTNNDAYFYYTCIKQDVDAVRKLPFLLRNDRKSIRLDLLKRKDSQCLLLVDNKYELPFEIQEAFLDLRECSLTQDWVVKYVDGGVSMDELNPYILVKSIENYIKKFYYHINNTVYKMIALYVYATYYYELFGQFPYLFLSGEKGSGKSVLDTVLYMFCFNAKLAANISEASLYRMTYIEGGTIIMDEMENLTSKSKNNDSVMGPVLKAGYQKGGNVYRFNSEKNISEAFDTYSPKIISNIFGLEDIIEDRCIRIETKRVKLTAGVKLEDPKKYIAERMDEIRAVTSKCCLSALEHFKSLSTIYDKTQFTTPNPRLSQILNPIYSVAIMCDIMQKNPNLKTEDVSKIDILKVKGEYVSAFEDFYTNVLVKVKQDIEENSPEGMIKEIIRKIAEELMDIVPSNDKYYTIQSNHKYKEQINHNMIDGWFEVNLIHLKCFIEEHNPEETAYSRTIHKWVRSSFNFQPDDVKRRTATIENEDLLKEFKGNYKPKVYHYRFRFKDFIKTDNDFLAGGNDKVVAEPISSQDLQNKLF